MKILTVVGARPQFIKAAPVSRALRQAGHTEFLVHTGQHYDYGMSQVFFDEMGIPAPDANLGIGSGSHGAQTGQMLAALEGVMLEQQPERVLVYGDTNSTLAGALAAVKLHIPVAHVEAGLRSFNRQMPEEHNRVLTDHCADLLFCPTQTAVDNLAAEGITAGVHRVGDTMYDAVLQFSAVARQKSSILQDLGLEPGGYLLATVHRPYNTDVPENLAAILSAFEEIGEPVVFPAHPRTRKMLEKFNLNSDIENLKLIEPVGYLDMLMLEQHARLLLTDSGGMQKEAYFFGVPCVTLRPETEWVETVEAGWNVLVGANRAQIVAAAQNFVRPPAHPSLYGDGHSAGVIVGWLGNTFDSTNKI
ncbi:MAG: UDP-N-acetylglucosamine 2-epimerase (non-hydrolyzing) [Chloroflexi bacterium]|nr:MAG: UDP-N-acetylglucosamine 2-epimerase (non-hydrolyzing) [Chloroflexota bacterium]